MPWDIAITPQGDVAFKPGRARARVRAIANDPVEGTAIESATAGGVTLTAP